MTDPTQKPGAEEQPGYIPQVLPILPVEQFVLYPSIIAPIVVGDEKSKRLVDEALAGNRMVGVVTRRPEADGMRSFDQLFEAGSVGTILKMLKMPDGVVRLLVHGTRRIRITGHVSEEPFLLARVEEMREAGASDAETLAMLKNVNQMLTRAAELSHLPEDLVTAVANLTDAGRVADLVTSNLNLKVAEQVEILMATDVKERVRRLLVILTREMEVLELGNKIQTRVKTEMDKNQREYYLREQMKAIRRELGDDDSGTRQVEELRERLAAKKLPDSVREVANREVDRLAAMQPSSAEYTVSRTYVDWILDLPWMDSSKDSINIRRAQKILDEDHFDLEKVKERILEYLSVLKLKNDMRGPILCLAGPPGVGKTSLGRSIARALNRQFHRLSLGGMRDEAEIRGHRRTYIGAMPGRILKGLKHVATNNPVMMLDEIDKLASDYRGDPAAALLEVLDPEQNNTFTDNYLDMPFDLSRVLFITTANMLETIPGPLRDRMEVITLSGYTMQEKLEIARKYLVPRQMTENGLERRHIVFTQPALERIIDGHTREAGLRNLERAIGAVCRKIAHRVAAGTVKGGATRITAAMVRTLLGPDKFVSDTAQRMGIPGVAIALAWTPVGGEILFIECSRTRGAGRFIMTGQVGDVMRESAHAAMTYLRGVAARLRIPDDAFTKSDIHIHIPAGAIPKDGPSAGITLCVALASLLSGRPVKDYLALTGEISLKGNVLPVGGVKEKVLGAARAGIQEIILPKRNEPDLEQLPAEIRRRMKFHLVDHVDQVILLSLQPAKKPAAKKPAAKKPAVRKPTASKTAKKPSPPKGSASTPAKKKPATTAGKRKATAAAAVRKSGQPAGKARVAPKRAASSKPARGGSGAGKGGKRRG